MIERKDLFSLEFYKRKPFTGSYRGMHYRLEKHEEDHEGETETVLLATVFPGPYSSENTPDEEKVKKTFSFSNEGIQDAVDWFNASYDEKPDYWAEKDRISAQT